MPISQSPREEWKVTKKDHPGSTADEIEAEPDWRHDSNEHYPGFKNRHGRRAGFAGGKHEDWDPDEDFEEDKQVMQETKREVDSKDGKLTNWQDILKSEKDISLYHPEGHPYGWRYVLDYTEDEIRYKQEWPANIKKREQEKRKEEQQEKDSKSSAKKRKGDDENSQQNGDAQRKQDGAVQTSQESSGDQSEDGQEHNRSEYDKLRDTYTPHEIALLRAVQHEKDYMRNHKSNDGKGHSGIKHNRTDISLAEDDQFTPDNWIPRSKELIRLTGKHPLNCEPDLRRLFDAGFITPNEIHYVRSHGAVPRLLEEYHKLEVTPFNGKSVTFSMSDIKQDFPCINIPVLIGCDNGRRKELNMIKRTHGFNWGPGAAGCAYWKGPLLRDVLLAAGVPEDMPGEDEKRYWVNLQGADNPGSALYETSVPFEYVMDAKNDVMLAYEMNDVPLPPDHGYPLRTVIPGYVGGRQVKWLQRVWVTDRENDSYWHIWDNRFVPPFVTSQDDELGKAMFHHPDTALYEQYLNSVITRPSQGEAIQLKAINKGKTYRIQGFAFNGRGDEVKRVEVTLDGGKTWLYCIRRFPDAPIRHGKKYWTWCFWHVDVAIGDVVATKSIRVRAWDAKFVTQPEEPAWNLMGSMNNVQYLVKSEMVTDDSPHVLFRHPVEPGNGEGGWQKESTENQISNAQKKTDAPKKQFTREEIEKHDQQDDCWIVVDGKVYDATSVTQWHPGGAAPIMMHAGTVHHQTTEEFSSIHDDYAYEKLNECVLGTVTDKAMELIKRTREDQDDPDARVPSDQALLKHRWVRAILRKRDWISEDTAVYTFELPDKKRYLGLGTCQHVELGFHLRDRMLIRQYTPTRPVLPRDSGIQVSKEEDSEDLHDGYGSFRLTVKTYFPDKDQPGGAFSNILTAMPIHEEVEMRGPTGEVVYNGHGKFCINGKDRTFKRVSMVLGGTGLTPGFSLLARVVLDPEDPTEIHVVDANKAEADIILKDDLDRFIKLSKGRLKVAHVLSHPDDNWKGLTGHVTEDIIRGNLFPPERDENLVLLCGPPPMIQKAAVPAFENWGYEQGKNMFGL
ncbi:hypothetical protein K431DRAFT_322297 [Polychaeton citri CBS 116435]|uniref:Nitrate reductase [NADPH] n=1 Tax=Polychaeton citri CBS 116435 TaxID=1314669 RepID=A0A9P4Q3C5_9PEZI|nr:hypothetical protein K431DRAFT_322297 [Polychaeton citri CBS 116435]